MALSLNHILQQLPPEDSTNYRLINKTLFSTLNQTCVVIDDDPTGNQTVYNIPLLTQWNLEVFVDEFKAKTPVFFVLTNSRSLSPADTLQRYKTIAKNILNAAKQTQRRVSIISRSDSTLRGHFPLEPITLQKHLKLTESITVFIPVMFEGNRLTVNDTHYIKNGDALLPVSQTPFSQDHAFGYRNANLKLYIEEKSNGTVNATQVYSFSLQVIRRSDVLKLAEDIQNIPKGCFCIFNCVNYNDLDKITHALLRAEASGKTIVYRTSSSFVPSYIGLAPKGLLTLAEVFRQDNTSGGLTIVGSYVKKSSEQLYNALSLFDDSSRIELMVTKVLASNSGTYLNTVIDRIDSIIAKGKHVIIYTSRELVTETTEFDAVTIARKISNALVALVKGISVMPRYIIAKGGITSHDLAVNGLGMKRSKVLGQVEAGIPLWEMGDETRFPKLPYIVFPGNVGDTDTLKLIISKFKDHVSQH